MKTLLVFILMVACSATHGVDDSHKKDEKDKVPSHSVNRLKGIRRDPPDQTQTPKVKRLKKHADFSAEPPSQIIISSTAPSKPPLPYRQFVDPTNYILLERMAHSDQYFQITRLIYDDAERAGIREIAGYTRSQAEEFVRNMRPTREYAQPTDFGDYIIRHGAGHTIIGRFMFSNFVMGGTVDEGFLQTQFYLISNHRGQGLGVPVLQLLIKDLIGPKIGRKCSFMGSVVTTQEAPEAGTFESTLRGVYGKSNLLRTHILDSNRIIAAYYKAGFGIKLWNGEVRMSYPPNCFPQGPSLERNEVATVLLISKIMQDCRNIKMNDQHLVAQQSEAVPIEAVIELKEILRNPREYKQQIASLKTAYLKLLVVSEPFTFLSVLNILHEEFGMQKEDLSENVSVEKASSMLALLDKETKVPVGLSFLRRFIPFTLQLSEEIET